MVPDVPFVASTSRAEQKLYVLLKDKLPDQFRVYHSVAYLVCPGSGPAREGEIDFLLLHPELGMLVIEVKGGSISYKGRERTWSSLDAGGRVHDITDPFKQASQGMRNIISHIERFGPSADAKIDFAYGHAVAFPDCEYSTEKVPPHAPPDIVIDASHLGSIEGRVRRIMDYWKKNRGDCRPLTKARVKALGRHVLAPRFDLGLTLHAEIEWEEAALAALTEEQLACLEFLEMNRRAVVTGPAGTGKTLIALEWARRLASEGARVLLLCYNLPLAALLRRLSAEYVGISGVIWAGAYHQLCEDWADRAGLEHQPPKDTGSEEYAQFWDEDTSFFLLQAAERLPERFDAVVVDEAQDFREDWWAALASVVRDPEECSYVLFTDPKQNIYGRIGDLPVSRPIFPLRLNCRNTVAIGSFCAQVAGERVRYPAFAGSGADPETTRYRSQEHERELVAGKLTWLFAQGLRPEQMVILGTHRLEHSFLAGDTPPRLAGKLVEAIDAKGKTRTKGALRYSTLHRFKGLEADVVLLCDLDGNEHTCTPAHLYTAASRAKHRLYLFQERGVSLFPGLSS